MFATNQKTHIEDLGSQPMSPIGGEDLIDGGYDHENLGRPKHRAVSKRSIGQIPVKQRSTFPFYIQLLGAPRAVTWSNKPRNWVRFGGQAQLTIRKIAQNHRPNHVAECDAKPELGLTFALNDK